MTQDEMKTMNRVLFVDDDIQVLNALKRGLHNEPYMKFFATGGVPALEILKTEDIHVIVTDMKMPGMSGLELLKIVNEEYPHVIKIILSGYTHLPQIIATINQVDIFKFITKPWDLENDFIYVVRAAVAQYNMRSQNDQLKSMLEKKNALYVKLIAQNDAKIKSLRRDFQNLRSLNEGIFEHIRKRAATESGEELIKDLAYLEHIVDLYVSALPSEIVTFDLSKVHSELIEAINQSEEGPAMVIDLRGDLNAMRLMGNMKLLVAAMMVICRYMYAGEDEKHISITPIVIEGGEHVYLTLDFNASECTFEQDRHRLESILFVVGKMAQFLKATVKITKTHERDAEVHHLELKLNLSGDGLEGESIQWLK